MPAALVLLLRKGWARRGFLAVGAAGGLLAGQSLFGIWHGSDLSVAWTAQLAGSGSSLVALGSCYTGSNSANSYDVFSLSPATGGSLWDHRVTEPSDDYSSRILSVSPLVISDGGSGPRGTTMARVLGPDGTQVAEFHVDGIMLAGSPVALDVQPTDGFGPPDFVADGMLVGVTTISGVQSAIVGYRLSDGQRQWVATTPDEVRDITVSGGSAVLVDESDPAYSLESVDLASGKLHSLGYFSQGVLEPDESGLYAVGGSYVIVNQHGDSSDQPPIAALRVPATKG